MSETYNLLLVGRTGNGKSSTGNLIFGSRNFKVLGVNDKTDDEGIKKKSGVINGHRLMVVDGTGIGEDDNDDLSLIESIAKLVFTDKNKQHVSLTAVILVLKFGVQFTDEERKSVEHVKFLFGDDVLRNCGVIVMTYGDHFNNDQGETFTSWCENQSGDFKQLFEECGRRCVLFNNRDQNRRQVDGLLRVIENSVLQSYTHEDFDMIRQERLLMIFQRSIHRGKEKLKEMKNLSTNKRKSAATKLLEELNMSKHQLEGSNTPETQKSAILNDINDLMKKTETETHRHETVVKNPTVVESTERQNYSFLLVGRLGNGKSSTGNSILGKDIFTTRKPYESSNTDFIGFHSSLVDGRSMFVVDGTGLGDTGDDIKRNVKELLESFEITFRNDTHQFNAVILVHYINEMSQVKMKSSVYTIKSILGPNVFKNWGIIAVTYGDLLDYSEDGEKKPSFENWCQEQTGCFQILLEECNNRCVLFDNITTDKNKQMEQRNKLMSVVDSMTFRKYTIYDFDKPSCKLSRRQLRLIAEDNSQLACLGENCMETSCEKDRKDTVKVS